MSDIDFDELDKAVNNIMSGSQPTAGGTMPNGSTNASPSVNQGATTSPSVPSLSGVQNLAIKRRGQFMDIMPQPSNNIAPKPVNRQGVNLAPTPDINEVDSINNTTSTPPVSLSVDNPPQDFSDTNIGVSDTNDNYSDTTTQEPLSSPFLADAKVEKRPLGTNFSTSEPSATPVVDDVPNNQIVSPIPDELKGDVLAVESNDLSVKAIEPNNQDKINQLNVDNNAPSAVPPEASEVPTIDSQAAGSIYDSSMYKEVKPTKAKHKSGVLKWIILTVILLLLGALAGAVYFYMSR